MVYDEFDEPLPAKSILGIIPAAKTCFFPSCILIADKGALFIHPQGFIFTDKFYLNQSEKLFILPLYFFLPNKSSEFRPLDDRLVRVASQHHYSLDFCTKLAAKLNRPQLEFCTKIIRHSLSLFLANDGMASFLEEITRLATELPVIIFV